MAWRIEWNPVAVVEAETEAAKYALKLEELGDRFLDEIDCGIHSNAITETGPSRSPKPVYRDHRNRFIAIGGPANLAVII